MPTNKKRAVRTYDGRPANILWVEIRGVRYALAYNHNEHCIELRERTQPGDVLFRFDDNTPVTEVRRIFGQL